MPGLAGRVARRPLPDLAARLARLADPMLRERLRAVERFTDPEHRFAIARVALGDAAPPRDGSSSSCRAFVHGNIANLGELRAFLGGAAGLETPEAVVAALAGRLGSGFAARLEGSFSAAVVELRSGALHLASDALGSHPVYWRSDADGLAFSASLAGLIREAGATPRLDPRALADFLDFGLVFGDKTLAEGFELLPPGAVLTFDPLRGARVERYFEVARLFGTVERSRERYEEAVAHAFGAAVRRAVLGLDRVGVSLSGGLDSRTILAALHGEAVPVDTYTLGIAGCADQLIAARLSRLAGTHHRFFELEHRYLRDFLPNMRALVAMTDGMYLSHGLTELLALQFLRDAGFAVLLRGHGGELAKLSLAWPFHTDARIRAMRSRSEFAHYYGARVSYVSRGADLGELLTPEWREAVRGQAEASLAASLDAVDLPPADLCAYVYLAEHHRRFTLPSLEVFRGLFDVRMPFADPEFLRALFSGPAEWREDTRLHTSIMRAHFAPLLRVRDSNTGSAPVAPGWLKAPLDKLNTACKRLGVYGWRHYHDFDAWMRRMLVASVEEVLLSPRSLERGVLRREALAKLVEETKNGRRDHGYLLQVLLILELWQREQENAA
jgi:asparagine synthase (glutamine-hydrolysing)